MIKRILWIIIIIIIISKKNVYFKLGTNAIQSTYDVM